MEPAVSLPHQKLIRSREHHTAQRIASGALAQAIRGAPSGQPARGSAVHYPLVPPPSPHQSHQLAKPRVSLFRKKPNWKKFIRKKPPR